MIKRDTVFRNWRLSSTVDTNIVYLKKFAYLPIKLNDGSVTWFKPYYKKQYHYFYVDITKVFKVENDVNISEHQMMYIILSGDEDTK